VKTLIWTNRIFLGFFLSLSLLAVAGKLSFGHGLADFIYCVFLWLVTIAFAVLFLVLRKKNSSKASVAVTIVSACVFLFLINLMTIGRGAEYRWNGNIFYSN
jgi:nitrate/nitrite transporter NarK